jgi:hypothetical protein
MPIYNPASATITATKSSGVTAVSIPSATTSTALLAANTNRAGLTIFNNSTSDLFIKLAATASYTAFSLKIDPGGYYEAPYGYTGSIAGIWTTANGNALVEEFI